VVQKWGFCCRLYPAKFILTLIFIIEELFIISEVAIKGLLFTFRTGSLALLSVFY
jgi:hypothetical protein